MTHPTRQTRAWTRPEDYWPPRRPARATGRQINRNPFVSGGEPTEAPRLLLSAIPFAMLMACLMVLAGAIMVAAWPGRLLPIAPDQPAVAEVGTAPKGWIDGR